MQRWKIIIEYKGCQFNGWQSQKDLTGVQDAIQSAIFKFSGESIKIYGAGRTDSGVHALGQVAHFVNDWNKGINNYKSMNGISKKVTICTGTLVANFFQEKFIYKRKLFTFFVCFIFLPYLK